MQKTITLESHYGNLNDVSLRLTLTKAANGDYFWNWSEAALKAKNRHGAGDCYELPNWVSNGTAPVYYSDREEALEAAGIETPEPKPITRIAGGRAAFVDALNAAYKSRGMCNPGVVYTDADGFFACPVMQHNRYRGQRFAEQCNYWANSGERTLKASDYPRVREEILDKINYQRSYVA